MFISNGLYAKGLWKNSDLRESMYSLVALISLKKIQSMELFGRSLWDLWKEILEGYTLIFIFVLIVKT